MKTLVSKTILILYMIAYVLSFGEHPAWSAVESEVAAVTAVAASWVTATTSSTERVMLVADSAVMRNRVARPSR